jgi:hypothetical protein
MKASQWHCKHHLTGTDVLVSDTAIKHITRSDIDGQKYGFYPIFLLFLQVGHIKRKSYKKGIENILDGNGFRYRLFICGIADSSVAAGTDFHCRKSGQEPVRED